MVNYNAVGLDLSGFGGVLDTLAARRKKEQEAAEVGAFGDRLLGTIATSGGAGGGAPSRAAEVLGVGANYADAVAGMESGGRYDAVGPTHPRMGRALGKYQVMEANVGPWSEKHLGRRLTGDQFLADREAQDAVFRGQFGEYASQHGPANAFSMWHSGRPLAQAQNARDSLGTRTTDYVNRGMAALGHKAPQPVAREAGTQQVQVASAADADVNAPGAREVGQFNLPGGRGSVGAGSEVDPQRIEMLRQGIRSTNPAIQQMAIQEINAIRAAQAKGTEYKFEKVGDELVRIDPRRGTVEPVYRGGGAVQTRNLMTPEERAQYGVDPNYKGPVQIDAKGALHFPGKTPEVPKPESAYDTERGKEYAGVAKELREGESAAVRAKNALRLMESLTNDPNFYSGAGGELVKRGKQALIALGVANPEAASPAEVFQTMANELTMGKLGGKLGAGVSNTDVSFIQQMSPNLTNTPVGNRLLINFTNKMMDRQIEVAKMAREFAKQNNGRLGPGFDEILSQHAAQNPLFGPDDIAAAQEAAQAISPKSSGLLDGLFGQRGQPSAAPAKPKVITTPKGIIIEQLD